MARFILETDDPSGRTCILIRRAFFCSSDNSSVYKYGQTDGLSVQTNYLHNSSWQSMTENFVTFNMIVLHRLSTIFIDCHRFSSIVFLVRFCMNLIISTLASPLHPFPYFSLAVLRAAPQLTERLEQATVNVLLCTP